MKRIRAKFECTHIIPAHDGYDAVANLTAVINNPDGTSNEENKSFSEFTPAGSVQIVISDKTPAHKFFREGREYYLDFIKVPL